jgi:simple sugar transport system ATP-binding protein
MTADMTNYMTANTDPQGTSAVTPLLEVRSIRKTFGSVVALDDVSLSVNPGELVAIVGDNGAGKSTLLKIMSGLHTPDRGQILVDGREVHFDSPAAAKRVGLETLFQDLALVDDLTVWQNIFLGRELALTPLGFQRRGAMIERGRAMLNELQIKVPSVTARVRRLSGGQRQGVAIGRAVGWNARLTLLDEPTAALGVRERLEVEALIERLHADGRTFLVVSHNFDQVMRLSDEVWVLRHGHVVGRRRTKETTGDELVALITGAKPSDERARVSF